MRAVGYFVEGARRNGAKRSIGDQNRAYLDSRRIDTLLVIPI